MDFYFLLVVTVYIKADLGRLPMPLSGPTIGQPDYNHHIETSISFVAKVVQIQLA